MIGFNEASAALQQGQHIRRERWDSDSEMFVQNGELMFSCRGGMPQVAAGVMPLDWRDMNAADWRILPATPVAR